MSLIDYERKLKKLAYLPVDINEGMKFNKIEVDPTSYSREIITLKQLKASFSDDIFMKEQLNDDNSIIYKLMTDKMF